MDSATPRAADLPSPDAVLHYVREVVAEVLGIQARRVDGPLDELALDSLTRLNITARFDHDLGQVPMTLMFDHRSVAELAAHLRTSHTAALADLLGATPEEALAEEPLPTAAAGTPVAVPPRNGDVAVIGVSGRYPGSPDIDAFWDTLRTGSHRVTEVPEDRWDWRRYYDPRRGQPHKTYGKWGAFLDDVSGFDADFFNILPSSAAEMDPQERLFLETAWNLLEETGYLGASTHEKSTGVFVGTMYDTYGRMGAAGWTSGRLVGPDAQPWLVANRVSYQFDLQGPSFAVNSACSSSLTAVHLACESLRREECRMAIAGGVNLILHPAHLAGLAAMNMLSADGRCKAFDAGADGFVPGEGVGAVLLKPLEAALADNDRIWGVIKASFVNTAGRTSGFTVPSSVAQAELVTETLRRAGIPPATISYVEAHGTGTELGDPIELAGLSAALHGAGTNGAREGARCAVGSAKANIGHLEGASGIAGLTKVLLQLKHRQIAPCIHLEAINPKIENLSGHFSFPVELTEWTTDPGVPRRAGVSAFGAGGSNAHVVVEEYPGPRAAPAAESDESATAGENVFLLSARTSPQLRTLVARTVRLLGTEPPSLRALAYTSQVGRKEMPVRLAVVAHGVEDLLAGLTGFLRDEVAPPVWHGVVGPDGADALLLDGEEGADYLAALTAKRRLPPLARLWTQGVPVDWLRLWPAPRPVRATLPAYPFDRKRHWAAAEEVPDAPADTTSHTDSAPPGTAPAPAAAPSAGPAGAASGQRPSPLRLAIERELRLIATAYLLVDESQIDTEADLLDLGFDSISLVGLIGQLGDVYGIDIDAGIVVDHPSLRALTSYIETEHHGPAVSFHTAAPR
ncbi:beta-ketoacyl synthase N-terminal-like domain-containing protein [Streptomyces hainanensis]|uniref:beta-ketoacyl synthase N-terminal-like domain-containing protein n=1 Tax=Streptomyces hainanensis TaxID=402648 RepID=UPI001404BD3D|nr:beta-ketoacyl synthase N-terminal-like domain-containing protein [Streptomyces hainanensis]